MILDDKIYGRVEVSEPVLLALLSAPAVQRLTGVLQHGISALVGVTQPVTRFEHSAGVMTLIQRLNGSLEEQIAGVLHDISHTVFSHVIDYVVDGHYSQSFHDEVKGEYLSRTDIPAILGEYGFDWRDFLDEARFPILEQPAPRLCADRLDYFLRDSLELRLATPAAVQQVLSHLIVSDGRIVVGDLPTARWMAYTYIAADDMSWANFREVGLYQLAAEAIRRGLAIGAISEADFWEQDAGIWARLIAHPDTVLNRQLALVNPATRFAWDEEQPTFRVGTKVRTIDPEVLTEAGPVSLSILDESFARHRERYIAGKQGEWPMRVVTTEAE